MEKPEELILFGGGSIPHILQAFAYSLNETHDVEVPWVWNLKDPYFLGWKVDPDSRLSEMLSLVFPLPGLSQFDRPDEFENSDTRLAWQIKDILELTGHKFAYEPGMLRGMPVGQEP